MADQTHAGAERAKICPRCAGAFGCGGAACWCGAVRLSEAQRNALRAQYADCLCPRCLAELAQASAAAPKPA